MTAGESITPVRLDVSQQADFQSAIDQVLADHSHLDVLVNNAGIVVAGALPGNVFRD